MLRRLWENAMLFLDYLAVSIATWWDTRALPPEDRDDGFWC